MVVLKGLIGRSLFLAALCLCMLTVSYCSHNGSRFVSGNEAHDEQPTQVVETPRGDLLLYVNEPDQDTAVKTMSLAFHCKGETSARELGNSISIDNAELVGPKSWNQIQAKNQITYNAFSKKLAEMNGYNRNQKTVVIAVFTPVTEYAMTEGALVDNAPRQSVIDLAFEEYCGQ